MGQKEQIAEAFERHVEQFGFAKANLDQVARELRISKKTIYVHFDDKREIYSYVVERQAAREQVRLRVMIADLRGCRAKVDALLRFVIDSARAHIAETDQDEWLQEYEIAADAFAKAHGDLLRETVAEGIDSGEFAAGDPVLVEKMVAGMLLQYTVLVNADPAFDRDAELVERILRFIG